MLTGIKSVKRGLLGILFPHICEVCGLKLSKTERFVCKSCLRSRFEIAAHRESRVTSDTLLPEDIDVQFALWNFDKGGHLQDLLHKLKYHRLYGVGEDLGMALARVLKKQSWFGADPQEYVLVPVPLHTVKKRKRGYNQARSIAEGMSLILNLPISDEKDLIRVKNTRTQTGFSIEKRRENIDQAFRVADKDAFEGKTCVIVDDVFTTGATTFELGKELLRSGAFKIMIATVAQA